MDRILLSHGSGGKLMHELIRKYVVPVLSIKELSDSAVLPRIDGRIAFTTDSYVITPIFFPESNIGELSINGTINDLSMVGAKPLYITAGFIIEEGFLLDDLKRILESMAMAQDKAGVRIVGGDTKVVPRGETNGIFINTAGVGVIPQGVRLSSSEIKPGDKIIVSGHVGTHGITIASVRNGLTFEPPLKSDTTPLNHIVESLLMERDSIHALRDPTRGGLATTLKEFAIETGLCMEIYEDAIPVLPAVRSACNILGFDPVYMANEGIMVIFVKEKTEERVMEILREFPETKHASIIGDVKDSPHGQVLLKTSIGGTRIIDMLTGEQLPRIC